MKKNRKLFYGILIILLIVIGIGAYLVTQFISSNSGISGKVLIGPQCPPFQGSENLEECKDKPYQGTFIVKTADGFWEVSRFSSDSNGEFSVRLQPGNYFITHKGSPACSSDITKVESDKFTEIAISCDTGIR